MNRNYLGVLLLVLIISACNSSKPKFEKIVFHRSVCFGEYDAYHLEIKRDTNVRIYAEAVYNHASNVRYSKSIDKEGYFTGKATANDFKRLDSIVQHIGIDTLGFDSVDCCDGIVYTIIVYYDHNKRVLKSMNPPEKANNLISVLNSICRNSSVKRTEKPFELETQQQIGH